jgi:hypothetical protein
LFIKIPFRDEDRGFDSARQATDFRENRSSGKREMLPGPRKMAVFRAFEQESRA